MIIITLIVIVPISILQKEDKDSKVYNTCGFSKEEQPHSSKDCTTYTIDYGGRCCYVEFLKQPPPDTNTSYHSFSTCLMVPSYDSGVGTVSQMAAHNLSYSIQIHCISSYLSIIILFPILIIIV